MVVSGSESPTLRPDQDLPAPGSVSAIPVAGAIHPYPCGLVRPARKRKGVPQVNENHDDLTIDQPDDTGLAKDLRKQLREARKELVQKDTEIGTLRDEKRASTVTDVLKDKGVNVKVAALIPKDIESTPEAVEKWLTEWAEVFNISIPGEPGSALEAGGNASLAGAEVSGVSQEARAAFEATRRVETGAGEVPQLGEAAVLKALADNKGKGSEAVIDALRAKGLVSG